MKPRALGIVSTDGVRMRAEPAHLWLSGNRVWTLQLPKIAAYPIAVSVPDEKMQAVAFALRALPSTHAWDVLGRFGIYAPTDFVCTLDGVRVEGDSLHVIVRTSPRDSGLETVHVSSPTILQGRYLSRAALIREMQTTSHAFFVRAPGESVARRVRIDA